MQGYKIIPTAPNYSISRGGKVIRNKDNKIMKETISKRGYTSVSINGKSVLVHRLVAETYLGPIAGKQIHHINGMKDDNRVSNLRIVTAKQHQIEHRIEREFMQWAVTTKRFKEYRATRLESLQY